MNLVVLAALLFVFTLETDMPRRYQRLTPEGFLPARSHQEVAEMLAKDEGHKVSRQRIQAIEASAFRKLRAALAAHGIKADDLLPD